MMGRGKTSSVPSAGKSATVVPPQSFSDGSMRPDSLVAKRHSAAVLHNAKTGEPITTGNHFDVPAFAMSSGLKRTATATCIPPTTCSAA